MFRSTHFAILLAVVLCASALPADPVNPASGETHGTAPVTGSSQKQPVQYAEGKSITDKSDLATDAQTYWSYRYTYNTPSLTYNAPVLGYIAPGLAGRTYSLGPYSWYYGIPAPVSIIEG